MDGFSAANRARCEAPTGFNHPIGSWSLSDWMTAALGELGEAANIAKKLNRVRDGIPGNTQSEEELRAGLADELADTFIYLDLVAQSQGINLPDAVRSKFDRTSAKIGYGTRLADPAATPDLQARYDVLLRELQRERAERQRLQADRDAARNDCGQVIEDTARALGCEPDNEAILQEIAALRRALGLHEVAA